MPSGLTPEMLLPKFNQMSPEAASLGRYGAFQVSEYSGAANISIPLYTVKSGDVSFPINLYYDATGIKVEQDATMVGLGWNLSYGGMISHIVCGEDDFREYPESSFRQDWWKEQKEKLKNKYQELPFWFEPRETVNGFVWDWDEIVLGHINLEREGRFVSDLRTTLFAGMAKGNDVPDVFQASFCGHTLSFTIDKRAGPISNGQYPIVVLNNNSRKYGISYKTDGISGERTGYPSSFVITDDKGINYCFEGKREMVLQGFGVDSYYLTKIYGPDGEKGKSKVEFYYDTQEVNLVAAYATRIKDHKPTAQRVYDKFNDIIPNTCHSLVSDYMLSLTNTSSVEIACGRNGHFFKVYPKKITTNSETIEFKTSEKGTRSDLPYASYISGITITPNTGGTPRNIRFAYDYFNETPAAKEVGSYSHQRLKLTNVRIDDQNYKFEYDDSIKLPSFASYSKDYWGYYNGANPNADRFVGCSPAYTTSNGVVSYVEHLDGSNRLASEKLCKVGMLKKITYPTGGYTLYEFEANRFNDKYYYPDASFKMPTAQLGSLSFHGTMSQTKKFKFSNQVVFRIKASIGSLGANDNVKIILRDSSEKKIDSLNIKGARTNFSEKKAITLAPNVEYTVEMQSKVEPKNHSSSSGTLYFSSENLIVTLTSKGENGGYSIGGGVRIKTIKNYDSDGTYLNGVKYEYSGGKLLSPTVQLEKHYIDCYNVRDRITFSFKYVNTEPSYLYICSLGIPAVVGYDKVVKKEVDESGKKIYRKTVLDFYNYGYITDDPATEAINSRMQNSFFFNSYYDHNVDHAKGHLNGMVKRDSVFNGSVLSSTTKYEYKYTKLDTIYYQKCLPTHLPNIDNVENTSLAYDLAFYRKVITWNYLTSKTETQYDNNGKQATICNTTSYDYNSSNYQLSQQTVSNGTESVRTNYWYPSDKKVTGYSRLLNKHILSEVTSVEAYRNGTFTGGSKNKYIEITSKATNQKFPVVSACYSILPNASRSSVAEMTVTQYDDYGNIREYEKKNGTPVTLIWSYNHQLPVMEIVGKRYDDVKKTFGSIITSLENAETIEKHYYYEGGALHSNSSDMDAIFFSITSAYNGGFSKGAAEAYVTTYEYSPWRTLSRIIKPNGLSIVYVYDEYGRLKETREDNSVIQKYSYNYSNK